VPVDLPGEVSLDAPLDAPLDRGRWPEALSDQRLWAARLRAGSESWAEEARRLRQIVRAPVLSGPCAQALGASGDGLAAEMSTLAAELANLTSAGPATRAGDRR
jgi:hypothetical protein